MSGHRRAVDSAKGFVEATRAVVAAQHPLAAGAGAEVIEAGGNVVDAAVASAFAAGVVDLGGTGLGGYGGHLVYHESASGRAWLIDFPSRAPLAAHPDLFDPLPVDPGQPGAASWWKTRNDANRTGALAVGVPAVVAGLGAAHRLFGKLAWADLLGPAIRLAREGVEFHPDYRRRVLSQRSRLERFPETARVFIEGWRGDFLRQPDLAATLELIAQRGPRALYEGELADHLITYLQSQGGILDHRDLSGYIPTIEGAFPSRYRGIELRTPGAASGAGILVPALRVLDGFDLSRLEPLGVERLALLAEVTGRIWPDRLAQAGALLEGNPAAKMFSDSYVESVRADIRAGALLPPALQQPPGCTSHLSVADAGGNAVSCTTTLMMGFGCGITVPGTGIVLNNAMNLFDPVPGRANSLASGKTALTNMCPTIVLKEGQPILILGASGGRLIPSMILQIATLVLDHAWSPARALAAPRFHNEGTHLFLEEGLAAETVERLSGMGYVVDLREWGSSDLGGHAPSIWYDEKHRLFGAADPRRHGGVAAL